ncbi:MAG: cytochrome c [Colwellia sp.]|nr:cytochrome c [Colwellia sp.]
MNKIKIFIFTVVLVVVSAVTVIYSGIIDVAADEPHGDLVYWLLEQTRENSIEIAAKDIDVPNLDDAEMLLSGGMDYQFMCASCHLSPGQKESDMSIGLYPAPPNLTVSHQSHGDKNKVDENKVSREQFWVIKHGIKASGMPAWGKTHDDKRIWDMVAFIKRLPSLTAEEYQIITSTD